MIKQDGLTPERLQQIDALIAQKGMVTGRQDLIDLRSEITRLSAELSKLREEAKGKSDPEWKGLRLHGWEDRALKAEEQLSLASVEVRSYIDAAVALECENTSLQEELRVAQERESGKQEVIEQFYRDRQQWAVKLTAANKSIKVLMERTDSLGMESFKDKERFTRAKACLETIRSIIDDHAHDSFHDGEWGKYTEFPLGIDFYLKWRTATDLLLKEKE